MNKEDALEIEAAGKLKCDHEELTSCGEKCPQRVACEELECRFEEGYHSLSAKAEGYLEAMKSRDLDLESSGKDECPTCGNKDIQEAELLEAWKEIDKLKIQMIESQELMGKQNIVKLSPIVPGSPVDWKYRYDKIKTAYVKTRLEVSGSFGNWDFNTRKRVLEKEISAEVGFTV